jgi:hypothetical protein
VSTPKIAVLDIERQSAVVDGIWDLKQNGYISPNNIVEPARTICFAWKWLGDDDVQFAAEWKGGSKKMVQKAWEVLDEADYVVGWNSKGFDCKHLRTEFILAGLTPPSPHKDLDLMLVARRNFGFMSNRLGYVGKLLGAGQKLETGGGDLWKTLRYGKGVELKDAQQNMEEYNKQDVLLTEEVYHILLPWVDGLNIPIYNDVEGPACSNCGSENIHYRGLQIAATRSYQRFQCQQCGKWGRETKSVSSVQSAAI